MPGEYQLAQRLLSETLANAQAEPHIDAQTFARALLHELLEHLRTTRSADDVISELESHIRRLEDPDDPVVTRGC